MAPLAGTRQRWPDYRFHHGYIADAKPRLEFTFLSPECLTHHHTQGSAISLLTYTRPRHHLFLALLEFSEHPIRPWTVTLFVVTELLMDFQSFIQSLSSSAPPAELSNPLKALWFDFSNNWERAHEAIQNDEDSASAWVHAYLHRKEGDLWNARYWYKLAGKRPVTGAFDEEREQIVQVLLSEWEPTEHRRPSMPTAPSAQ